jgi:Rrf2 family transcriptional regulator, cysteine metabolism repressor
MRLSLKSEYACLALIVLSRNYDKGLTKIEEIATSQDIPQKFLEQILLTLKRGGLLHSRRGIDGGYRLAHAPCDIRLADVIRQMDGPIAPVSSVSTYFYEHSPIEKNAKLKAVFLDIRNYTAGKMENTTFGDLL